MCKANDLPAILSLQSQQLIRMEYKEAPSLKHLRDEAHGFWQSFYLGLSLVCTSLLL